MPILDTVQRKSFSIGARVAVAPSERWKQSFMGTVCDGPESVDTLKGPEYFYWVEFDEPQEDVNGPDRYRKAQILSCYLEHAI
jgi:hypothetical protein